MVKIIALHLICFFISIGIVDAKNKNNFLMYIGTYTNEGSEGVYLSTFDADLGTISKPELVASLSNASFQYISSNKKQLWSVSESGGLGSIYGFNIKPKDGRLKQLSSFSSLGYGPCYVSKHEKSSNVLTANYKSGNVANIPINKNGIKSASSFSIQHKGKGPNINRQEGPHAHCIKVDLDGKFIYSADLGIDKVYVYTIENNELKLYKELEMEAGSGPRHLDFHPEMKAMAVVHELNSTVAIYKADENGCFSILQSTISTIPKSFTANNQCADIHYSPNGNFLYASNRGHNSIVIYKVNKETMDLELVEQMDEKLNWPRNFCIDPSGHFLIAANQNSNLITVYEIDAISGKLTYTGNNLSISKPVCINLLDLNK